MKYYCHWKYRTFYSFVLTILLSIWGQVPCQPSLNQIIRSTSTDETILNNINSNDYYFLPATMKLLENQQNFGGTNTIGLIAFAEYQMLEYLQIYTVELKLLTKTPIDTLSARACYFTSTNDLLISANSIQKYSYQISLDNFSLGSAQKGQESSRLKCSPESNTTYLYWGWSSENNNYIREDYSDFNQTIKQIDGWIGWQSTWLLKNAYRTVSSDSSLNFMTVEKTQLTIAKNWTTTHFIYYNIIDNLEEKHLLWTNYPTDSKIISYDLTGTNNRLAQVSKWETEADKKIGIFTNMGNLQFLLVNLYFDARVFFLNKADLTLAMQFELSDDVKIRYSFQGFSHSGNKYFFGVTILSPAYKMMTYTFVPDLWETRVNNICLYWPLENPYRSSLYGFNTWLSKAEFLPKHGADDSTMVMKAWNMGNWDNWTEHFLKCSHCSQNYYLLVGDNNKSWNLNILPGFGLQPEKPEELGSWKDRNCSECYQNVGICQKWKENFYLKKGDDTFKWWGNTSQGYGIIPDNSLFIDKWTDANWYEWYSNNTFWSLWDSTYYIREDDTTGKWFHNDAPGYGVDFINSTILRKWENSLCLEWFMEYSTWEKWSDGLFMEEGNSLWVKNDVPGYGIVTGLGKYIAQWIEGNCYECYSDHTKWELCKINYFLRENGTSVCYLNNVPGFGQIITLPNIIGVCQIDNWFEWYDDRNKWSKCKEGLYLNGINATDWVENNLPGYGIFPGNNVLLYPWEDTNWQTWYSSISIWEQWNESFFLIVEGDHKCHKNNVQGYGKDIDQVDRLKKWSDFFWGEWFDNYLICTKWRTGYYSREGSENICSENNTPGFGVNLNYQVNILSSWEIKTWSECYKNYQVWEVCKVNYYLRVNEDNWYLNVISGYGKIERNGKTLLIECSVENWIQWFNDYSYWEYWRTPYLVREHGDGKWFLNNSPGYGKSLTDSSKYYRCQDQNWEDWFDDYTVWIKCVPNTYLRFEEGAGCFRNDFPGYGLSKDNIFYLFPWRNRFCQECYEDKDICMSWKRHYYLREGSSNDIWYTNSEPGLGLSPPFFKILRPCDDQHWSNWFVDASKWYMWKSKNYKLNDYKWEGGDLVSITISENPYKTDHSILSYSLTIADIEGKLATPEHYSDLTSYLRSDPKINKIYFFDSNGNMEYEYDGCEVVNLKYMILLNVNSPVILKIPDEYYTIRTASTADYFFTVHNRSYYMEAFSFSFKFFNRISAEQVAEAEKQGEVFKLLVLQLPSVSSNISGYGVSLQPPKNLPSVMASLIAWMDPTGIILRFFQIMKIPQRLYYLNINYGTILGTFLKHLAIEEGNTIMSSPSSNRGRSVKSTNRIIENSDTHSSRYDEQDSDNFQFQMVHSRVYRGGLSKKGGPSIEAEKALGLSLKIYLVSFWFAWTNNIIIWLLNKGYLRNCFQSKNEYNQIKQTLSFKKISHLWLYAVFWGKVLHIAVFASNFQNLIFFSLHTLNHSSELLWSKVCSLFIILSLMADFFYWFHLTLINDEAWRVLYLRHSTKNGNTVNKEIIHEIGSCAPSQESSLIDNRRIKRSTFDKSLTLTPLTIVDSPTKKKDQKSDGSNHSDSSGNSDQTNSSQKISYLSSVRILSYDLVYLNMMAFPLRLDEKIYSSKMYRSGYLLHITKLAIYQIIFVSNYNFLYASLTILLLTEIAYIFITLATYCKTRRFSSKFLLWLQWFQSLALIIIMLLFLSLFAKTPFDEAVDNKIQIFLKSLVMIMILGEYILTMTFIVMAIWKTFLETKKNKLSWIIQRNPVFYGKIMRSPGFRIESIFIEYKNSSLCEKDSGCYDIPHKAGTSFLSPFVQDKSSLSPLKSPSNIWRTDSNVSNSNYSNLLNISATKARSGSGNFNFNHSRSFGKSIELIESPGLPKRTRKRRNFSVSLNSQSIKCEDTIQNNSTEEEQNWGYNRASMSKDSLERKEANENSIIQCLDNEIPNDRRPTEEDIYTFRTTSTERFDDQKRQQEKYDYYGGNREEAKNDNKKALNSNNIDEKDNNFAPEKKQVANKKDGYKNDSNIPLTEEYFK